MTLGGVVCTLLVLLLLAAYDRWFREDRHHAGDWEAYDQQSAFVAEVADGDTVTLRPLDGDPEVKVRLLGIDAPELRGEDGRPAYWAVQAKNYLNARTRGQAVTVRLETTRTRDRYDRLLAYLYLDDAANLNLEMVREGHAYAHRQFSHSMRPQFEQAEVEARRRQRGLWQNVTESQMPPWRRRWLEQQRDRESAAGR